MTVTAIQQAAKVLIDGGVVAYPTEGVFGLGCMPHNRDAVSRILHIKRRPIEKGLILVASTPEQLRGWISPEYIITFPEPDPGAPITWIVPRQTHQLCVDQRLCKITTASPCQGSVSISFKHRRRVH